jgi:hypothetical protein
MAPTTRRLYQARLYQVVDAIRNCCEVGDPEKGGKIGQVYMDSDKAINILHEFLHELYSSQLLPESAVKKGEPPTPPPRP